MCNLSSNSKYYNSNLNNETRIITIIETINVMAMCKYVAEYKGGLTEFLFSHRNIYSDRQPANNNHRAL